MEGTDDVTRTASPAAARRSLGPTDLLPSSVRPYEGNTSTHSLVDTESELNSQDTNPVSEERNGPKLLHQQETQQTTDQDYLQQLKSATRKRLREEDRSIRELQAPVKSQDGTITDQQEKLKEQEAEVKRLRLDNQELRQINQQLRQDNQELRQDNQQLGQNSQQLHQDNQQLKKENQALKEQNLQLLDTRSHKIPLEASDDPRPAVAESFRR